MFKIATQNTNLFLKTVEGLSVLSKTIIWSCSSSGLNWSKACNNVASFYIDLKLETDFFSEFQCSDGPHRIGVNLKM